MELSRTSNTIRNTYWSLISKVINLFLPFVSRTIIIKSLGMDYIGLGGLFTSILSVLSITELGISSALVFSMYKPIAEDDKETICALMALYRKAYRIIGTIIFVLGIVISFFLPMLIKGTVPPDINIYILYYITLFNTAIGYFLYGYRNCLFTAHQRNDVAVKIQMFCIMFQNLLQIILLVLFKNYYFYVIVLPVFTILSNIIIAAYSVKIYPEYKCYGKVKPVVMQKLKKQISGLFLGQINITVRTALDNMFISVFMGLTMVGMYSNYFLILNTVIGFVRLIDGAMVAGVGNSVVVDTVEKNYADFKRFTFMSQWIISFCTIAILCLIQPFMNIWVGKELMFRDSMAVICAVYMFLTNIGMVRGIYTSAIGLWWEFRVYSMIDIVMNFMMNLIFVYLWGAYGILLATALVVGLIGIPWSAYILFENYFGMKRLGAYLWELMKYMLITAVTGAVTYYICVLLPCKGKWAILAIRMILCIILPNFIFWVIYQRGELFKETVSFCKSAFQNYLQKSRTKRS